MALALTKGVSLKQKKDLVDKYRGLENLYDAIYSNQFHSRDQESCKVLQPQLSAKAAEAELRKVRVLRGWVVALGEAGYPALLSEIPDPPLLLYGKGTLPPSNSHFLGFIGPREASQYGIRTAKWLAQDLAKEGLVLVSGLARGIDAIAHQSSVYAKTPTIAVLGCGLDQTYPKEHGFLRAKIEACGAVVTEFPVGEVPRKENFPKRNRIIAGLSKGILVMEAAEKSGVKITVKYALSYDRDIYAVPGPIDASMSIYPNRLISEGAKLVATTGDILQEFGIVEKVKSRASKAEEALPNVAKSLLAYLDKDNGLSADDLAVKGNWSITDVMSLLTELELKGYVERQSDSRYVRIPAR